MSAAPQQDPPNDSLSTMFVTRLWHIMDVRNLTVDTVSERTGIPLAPLWGLYNGNEELTVDQLARFVEVLDVHWMAIFDGFLSKSALVPEELMNREVARLAAELHRMPKVGRAMLLAAAARGHTHG